MAVMQGITGKLSGKMGSAVFRVNRGTQVVAQYNPKVSNPNTPGQQAQRARFKLMSQLAAIMAPAFGTMSTTQRAGEGVESQRNAFQRLNFPLVEVEAADNEVIAKIPMEQLQLTSSFRDYGSLRMDAEQNNSIALSIRVRDAGPSGPKKGRIVLVGFGTMGTNAPTRQAYVQQIVDVPVVDGTINHTFDNVESGTYTILSYGLIPSESATSRIDIDNIHTPDDENFISAIVLNAMVANGDLAETITIGGNVSVGTV